MWERLKKRRFFCYSFNFFTIFEPFGMGTPNDQQNNT